MRIGLIIGLILCWSCCSADLRGAQDPAPEADWQKFKGKPEPIPPNPTFATPGMFLNLPERLVAFPAGGLPIDLPIDATLSTGKSVKAALLPNRALWIDLDSDGKASQNERFNQAQYGYGPITIPLKYKNETEGSYTFHLLSTATPGTYKLATGQMIRYTFTWKRKPVTILLLDQNNNGRYDETGQDVVMVDARPGGFLAKTITVGADAGSAVEIVVYPNGTTIELREYAGPTGVLDPVSGYTPAQSGVTLSYVAVDSENARPGFSATFPRARVPEGAYNFVTAALTRGGEQILVEKGGLQPITVEKDKTATLAWGGEVELEYGFRRAGDFLVFDGFKFSGKAHKELYRAQAPSPIKLGYVVNEIFPSLDVFTQSATAVMQAGTVETDESGKYKPVQVKHRGVKMMLMLRLSYPSGILGSIEVKDKLEFTPQDAPK